METCNTCEMPIRVIEGLSAEETNHIYNYADDYCVREVSSESICSNIETS